jgi:hypothetical protein
LCCNDESMPNDTAVRTFISSAFRSVWSLDLVQLLMSEPGRSFTRLELIDLLRASDLVVKQSVESLLAVGLVMIEDNETVSLRVPDDGVKRLLNASIELYRHSPDKVRRLIVAQSHPGATAFAEAFRLRKD